ncbi:hypothetical protein [Haloechinothrix sp. LS1_15]|uniref:hypothetical protein n=1 Tax=Haloechinothrix sp. LS1_15 TaxID=2652248 RepID=UPI0029457657|nr:hypothetical protein [Haloechinothrix sp. LS1_15]MDV6011938.1 hypothetical protein [Haloechinothrix sp. LS1_15]
MRDVTAGGNRPTNTLSELTCLGLHRPARGAGAAEVAGYYGRLAAVHRHLAAEATTGAERVSELALAHLTRRRAELLARQGRG